VKVLAAPAALLAAFFIFLWVMPFLGRPRIRKFVRERWSMMPWKGEEEKRKVVKNAQRAASARRSAAARPLAARH